MLLRRLLVLVLVLLVASAGAQKVLRIAIDADPINLDPAQVAGIEAHRFKALLYPSLLRYADDLTLVPALAASFRLIDDLTYEFTLRDDVLFHDGQRLRAADVKRSIERVQDPGIPSPEGFELSSIASVEIVDDLTLRITTSSLNPGILHNIAWGLGIHPAETDVDLRFNAVGTGPFRLVEYVPDSRIVLERFDGYFGPRPHLDRVEYLIITDTVARINALRAGDVHVARILDPKATIQLRGAAGVTLGPVGAPSLGMVYFNTRRAPFDDARVRLAISCALDRAVIADLVYFGDAKPTGPIPPAMGGWALPVEEFECYGGAELDRARALLAEAGHPDGFATSIVAASRFPLLIEAAEVIREQLAPVGIRVDIRIVEFAELVDMQTNSRDFDISIRPSNSGRDPDANFYRRFHSTSPANTTGYASAEADRLMDLSRSSADQAFRYEVFADLQRLITSDSPKLFLTDQPSFEAYSDDVLNWLVHPLLMHWNLEQVDLRE